jgi:hypothetical protein
LAVLDWTLAYDLTLFGPPCQFQVVVHETELPDVLTRFEVWLPDVAAEVPQRFWQSSYEPAASHCVAPVASVRSSRTQGSAKITYQSRSGRARRPQGRRR